MRPTKALFVTLEGIEGSGKTTVANKLVNKLKDIGCSVIYVQEPGGCQLSDKIRELLLYTDEAMAPEAELLLFMASRAQTVSSVIEPALEMGTVVICDRHIDSTVAYQGYGRCISIDNINMLNNIACKGLVPDITFLLDLPVDIGLKRQLRLDRISNEQVDFHERVRTGFLDTAAANSDRIHIIDASQTLANVVDTAWNMILSLNRFKLQDHT